MRRAGIVHLVVLVGVGLASSLLLDDRGLYTLDEGSLLSISTRVARGEVMYRDICSAIFPGIYYTQSTAFRWFGVGIAIERDLGTLVFLATTAVLYLLGRRITSPSLAFVGTLAFVLVRPALFPIHTVLNYTQVSFLLAAAALAVSLSPLGFRTALAVGVLTAGSGLFKQNYGLFVILTVLGRIALLSGVGVRRKLTWSVTYLAAGAAATAPVLLYLWAVGAFGEFWRNCVLGPLQVVPGAYVAPWPPLMSWEGLNVEPRIYLPSAVSDILLDWLRRRIMDRWPWMMPPFIQAYYLAPIAVCGAGLWWARRRRSLSVAGTAVLGLFMYVGIFPRTDYAHLTAAVPIAALLLGVLLEALPVRARPWAGGLLLGSALLVGGAFVVLVRTGMDTPLRTPRGTVLVREDQQRKVDHLLSAIDRHLEPDEPLFIAPVDSMIYFLSGRPNPTRFDYVEPVNIGAKQDAETVERLAAVDWLVFSDRDLRDIKMPPIDVYAPKLYDYLLTNFEPVWSEVRAFDEVYLCRRVSPPPAPAIDLLQAPREILVRGPEGEAPAPDAAWPVEFLAGRALQLAPPEQPRQQLIVRYELELPAEPSELRVTLLGRPEIWWSGGGPGVYLRGRVVSEGESRVLFDRLFDPGGDRGDRRGRDIRGDLSPWAGGSVTLEFEAQVPVAFDVAGIALRRPGIHRIPDHR